MTYNVSQALAYALGQQLDRLDAHLLALKALGRNQTERAWLMAHDDAVLSNTQRAHFEQLVDARAQGHPLAYLVGEKEFFGITLQVSPSVLVPRPDTETLVNWALELLPNMPTPNPAVLDLGTGSGAVALAIKAHAPQTQVSALDASPAALQQAIANGEQLGLSVLWQLSNWFETLGQQQFNILVSNPPYIEANDPHMAQLRFEPQTALTSGADGLDDIRTIIAQAPHHLHPGGWLLLEHGWNQAEAVGALLSNRGFTAVASRSDLDGHQRCTGGQWVNG